MKSRSHGLSERVDSSSSDPGCELRCAVKPRVGVDRAALQFGIREGPPVARPLSLRRSSRADLLEKWRPWDSTSEWKPVLFQTPTAVKPVLFQTPTAVGSSSLGRSGACSFPNTNHGRVVVGSLGPANPGRPTAV